MDEKPYNPLDYEKLTGNLIRALMEREPVSLPLPERFPGPGVYALFYTGDFPAYSRIRSEDVRTPIYVGKAVPPGARKGGVEDNLQSPTLYKRIHEHVASIQSADNLELKDFLCRYMTVVPLWITVAERFLIEHYRPIWNVCIDGFGLHNPGRGRFKGKLPWWDALHPGRHWAANLRQTKSAEEALRRLSEFLGDEGPAREKP